MLPGSVGRLGAAVALALVLAGCGRSYETDPQAILAEGKHAVDSASAIHFSLSSGNASGSGLFITGGEGDAVRPDGFAGTFTVSRSGLLIPLKVVSVHHAFSIQLPFTSTYEKTDPSAYGFADPGHLIDPATGLSSVLSSTTSASLGDRDRLGGTELYEIDATLPGRLIHDLLTDADPAQPVRARIGVDVDSHQVRRVVLTGPFFTKGQQATFTLLLDRYGESATVTPPAS